MKDVAVFLYDLTGVMAEPWLQAGFVCVCVCGFAAPAGMDAGR